MTIKINLKKMILISILLIFNLSGCLPKSKFESDVSNNDFLPNIPTYDNPFRIGYPETEDNITFPYGIHTKVVLAYLNIDNSTNGINCSNSSCNCINNLNSCKDIKPRYSSDIQFLHKNEINGLTIYFDLDTSTKINDSCITMCNCTINCNNKNVAHRNFNITWK